MSYVFPAVAGSMGSTTYYQANLRARELAAVAKTAAELPAWRDWSIFERFQRDLAYGRVKREIVPYLVQTRDRFFGSLIVLVYEPKVFEFDSVESFRPEVGASYKGAAERLGFLTIEGGELVVLDGQHRLVALREVVTADRELTGPYRDAIAEDELCVLFIRHESFEKTRRIFNKVNRYAKPTSKSDNIITSEDDGVAVVTRWLVEKTPPLGTRGPQPPLSFTGSDGEPLVEWRSSQLDAGARKLTTLNHLYQTVEVILHANGIMDFDERHRVNRPEDAELLAAYELAAGWWRSAIANIQPFQEALARPSRIPEMRRFQHESSLLMRPVSQVALFRGIAGAVRKGLNLDTAFRRASRIGWRAASAVWEDTFIYANGRMNARAEGVSLGGDLISYLIAAELHSKDEVEALRDRLATAKGAWHFDLPKPVSTRR